MINPCKAALEISGQVGINKVVKDCYTVANNYGLSDTESRSFCTMCQLPFQVEKFRTSLKTPCSYNVKKSVVWNQTPSYFPTLYKQYQNIDIALEKCKSNCNNDPSCEDMCILDSRAIVEKDKNKLENYKKEQIKHRSKSMTIFIIIIIIIIFIIWPLSWLYDYLINN